MASGFDAGFDSGFETRHQLTIYSIDLDGVDIGAGVNVLAVHGVRFANDGKTIFRVVNGSGSERTLEVVTPRTIGRQELAIDDHTVTLPASATRYVGPFPMGIYNQPTGPDGGKVYLDMTTDDLTFTAVRTP